MGGKRQYTLWLYWQPDKPLLKALNIPFSTPPRRRKSNKKPKEVKPEIKEEIKTEIKEEFRAPSGSPAFNLDELLHSAAPLANQTPPTTMTLPKRPRVLSSESGTPTRAPKKRVGGAMTTARAQEDLVAFTE